MMAGALIYGCVCRYVDATTAPVRVEFPVGPSVLGPPESVNERLSFHFCLPPSPTEGLRGNFSHQCCGFSRPSHHHDHHSFLQASAKTTVHKTPSHIVIVLLLLDQASIHHHHVVMECWWELPCLTVFGREETVLRDDYPKR